MSSSDPSLPDRLGSSLSARLSLQPSSQFLTNLLSSLRPQLPPYPALLSTAQFRLLASDITSSLATTNGTSFFPIDISDVTVKERRLQADVPVQVLDITDVGCSKWSQVEAIERVERGEEVRGREVIRTVAGVGIDDEDGDADVRSPADAVARNTGNQANPAPQSTTKRSQGPHRLLLQDARKTNVTAFELSPIPQIFIGEDGMCIGCKVILKAGTLIRRGMVMLQPENVVVLGGKIESWDRKWREERKGRLIEDVEREQRERRQREDHGEGER